MIPTKKHVPKPIAHSPRDEMALASVREYSVRTYLESKASEVRTPDAGQALAAMTTAKANGITCLVYAVGDAYGEECIAPVDADWLMSQIVKKQPKSKTRAQELNDELFMSESQFEESSYWNRQVDEMSTLELFRDVERRLDFIEASRKQLKAFLKRNRREFDGLRKPKV